MKNKTKYLLILALAISGVTISCKKDDGPGKNVDCSKAIDLFSTTLTAYSTNPSIENCIKYVEALRTYIKSDCYGFLDRKTYEKELEDLEDQCQ